MTVICFSLLTPPATLPLAFPSLSFPKDEESDEEERESAALWIDVWDSKCNLRPHPPHQVSHTAL